MKLSIAPFVAFAISACGVEGPEGKQGAQGAAGPGIAQSVQWMCNNTDETARHDVYVFPDASIMTTCEVTWAYDDIATGFHMWRAEQVGAATAGCLVNSSVGAFVEFAWNKGTGSTATLRRSDGTSTIIALNCKKY